MIVHSLLYLNFQQTKDHNKVLVSHYLMKGYPVEIALRWLSEFL